MNAGTAAPGHLRILFACARPLAARILKLRVRFQSDNGKPEKETVVAVASLLQEKLKLAILNGEEEGNCVTFHLSTPLPPFEHLKAEVKKCDGVRDVSCEEGGRALEVHRPGEELRAVLSGLENLSASVQVDVLEHARPQDLRERLEARPGYDVLHLACHGNEIGNLLLEDGCGWARIVGPPEFVGIVAGKVKILVLGACHGERSLASLLESEEERRPPVVVYSQGEFPIPTRAVHLFSEGFYRGLAEGAASGDAFGKGVERVRYDDFIGEVAYPDSTDDPDKERAGPSPFKRFRIDERQAVVFAEIEEGKIEVRDLRPPAPPHRKIIRADELMVGRERDIACVMEKLLPPRSGLREEKKRLIHLHGEGGIGKTRLAQAVCDALEDYRHFPGGIYEVDCEHAPDSVQFAVAILKALGREDAEKTRDPAATLVDVLKKTSDSTGDILLMLDNVDPLFLGELAEETARLLKQVLSDCPAVRILTTCRTKLHLGGHEADFIVDPLDSSDAVNLFLGCIPDRDIQTQVGSLPTEDFQHVINLVAALQGHPLSLFLAAYRIGVGAELITEQLRHAAERISELLEAPELKGVPARQRSLRASLDLSYNLLSERGKELFRRSSFFPGGLHRHVNTLDSLLGEDWREAAQEITEVGLLRFEREAQWYWMLNPVREYAETLLVGEEGDLFRKAVSEQWAHYTALGNFLLNPPQSPKAIAQLDLPEAMEERSVKLAQLHDNACAALCAEEDNILFAFRWALENHVEAAEGIGNNMVNHLTLHGKRRTNVWIARATLEACTVPELRAKWFGNLGICLSDIGDRQGALAATQEALDLYRQLANKDSDTFSPLVGTALNDLGNSLSELGKREEALEAARGALEIRRDLAMKHPESFLPDVAMALNNLGNRLSEVGNREEALEATREALDLQLHLAAKHPDAYLPGVAMALDNLGNRLSELGRREEALKATQGALEIRRNLAKKHPEAFLPGVATTLNNLGKRLWELKAHEEAVEAAGEALRIRRELARKHPEVFLPCLAMTLLNVGGMLSELGAGEDALRATQESLGFYRTLAKKHREAFLPHVAMALSNLAVILSELGDHEDALKAAQESLSLYYNLTEKHHKVFLPYVAMTLNNLGNRLSKLGAREDALKATKKALEIRRQLAQKLPEAFLPDVAMALNSLGNRLSDLGKWEEAGHALKECLDIYRNLAQKQPAAFIPNVAMALNNLGTYFWELGACEEALKSMREAVDLYRQLASDTFRAFLPGFAAALANLGEMRSDLDDREGALDCFRELVEVGRRYAELTGNITDAVQGCIRLADLLVELGRDAEALPFMEEAAGMLEPIAGENEEAMKDLTEVNKKRAKIQRSLDPSRAG